MDFTQRRQEFIQSKGISLIFLILIWAIVGFIIGIAMGRIIWMIQLI